MEDRKHIELLSSVSLHLNPLCNTSPKFFHDSNPLCIPEHGYGYWSEHVRSASPRDDLQKRKITILHGPTQQYFNLRTFFVIFFFNFCSLIDNYEREQLFPLFAINLKPLTSWEVERWRSPSFVGYARVSVSVCLFGLPQRTKPHTSEVTSCETKFRKNHCGWVHLYLSMASKNRTPTLERGDAARVDLSIKNPRSWNTSQSWQDYSNYFEILDLVFSWLLTIISCACLLLTILPLILHSNLGLGKILYYSKILNLIFGQIISCQDHS